MRFGFWLLLAHVVAHAELRQYGLSEPESIEIVKIYMQLRSEGWPWPVIREIFREIWGVFQGKKFFTKYAKYSA